MSLAPSIARRNLIGLAPVRVLAMRWLALACIVASLPVYAVDSEVERDWNAVLAFDEGPGVVPKSREEAFRIAREHFAKQRAAIDSFIRKYPNEARVFDAQLKKAGIKAAEGKMENRPPVVAEALNEMLALERRSDVDRRQRADAAFHRISLQFQTLEGTDEAIRQTVVTAARNFASQYPDDRRAPRLLVEAATQCDSVPDTMRDLLERARQLSREPALNERIADDLRRMDALGQPVVAQFESLQGQKINLSAFRGNVVVLVFWSAESPHSLIWMRDFVNNLRKLPKDQLRVIGVSLDQDRRYLDEAMGEFGISWPTHFDGKGWENAVARPLGINAIPTVWILDKRGILRVLNARDSYETWIRLLLREKV